MSTISVPAWKGFITESNYITQPYALILNKQITCVNDYRALKSDTGPVIHKMLSLAWLPISKPVLPNGTLL